MFALLFFYIILSLSEACRFCFDVFIFVFLKEERYDYRLPDYLMY